MSAAVGEVGITCDWSDMIPYQNFCYGFYSVGLDFLSAHAFCQKRGADLAWIDNAQEMAWIKTTLVERNTNRNEWYIGKNSLLF